MKRLTIITIIMLSQSACGTNTVKITPAHYLKAAKVCDNNDGLKSFSVNSIFIQVTVRCINGATFKIMIGKDK